MLLQQKESLEVHDIMEDPFLILDIIFSFLNSWLYAPCAVPVFLTLLYESDLCSSFIQSLLSRFSSTSAGAGIEVVPSVVMFASVFYIRGYVDSLSRLCYKYMTDIQKRLRSGV